MRLMLCATIREVTENEMSKNKMEMHRYSETEFPGRSFPASDPEGTAAMIGKRSIRRTVLCVI